MKPLRNTQALVTLYFVGIASKIAGLDGVAAVALLLATCVALNLIRLTIKEVLQ